MLRLYTPNSEQHVFLTFEEAQQFLDLLFTKKKRVSGARKKKTPYSILRGPVTVTFE